MYLFFDTETTGLPRNWKAPVTDLDNWPRMIQIAWMLYDKQGNLQEEQQYIIKPDGFTIPKEASDIHRVTTERAMAEGVDLIAAISEFSQAMSKAEHLIAHNISFDEKIVGAEFLRTEVSNNIDRIHKFCTMKSTTDFCEIPGKYGFKWPSLSELHEVLFGEDFEDAHDALVDVRACAKSFFELKKRMVIFV